VSISASRRVGLPWRKTDTIFDDCMISLSIKPCYCLLICTIDSVLYLPMDDYKSISEYWWCLSALLTYFTIITWPIMLYAGGHISGQSFYTRSVKLWIDLHNRVVCMASLSLIRNILFLSVQYTDRKAACSNQHGSTQSVGRRRQW
jgi:hypothetical protein